uniref:ricin-type beta-trefoil lectin domain protein n=1 Tax=Streptomyces xiaopingdaonensis TaxID=1565415 RepID=UPI000494A9C3
LPRLVRSMGTTAIGKGPRTTPVGRPNRAALAGAAVAGVLLLSVPLVVLGWNSDESSSKTEPTAGTVLNDDEADKAGQYEADTEPKQEKPKAEKSDAAEEQQAEAKTEPKEEKEEKSKAEQKDEEKKSSKPAKKKPVLAVGVPVALHGHKSDRCINVGDKEFNDGTPLRLQKCDGTKGQQWRAAEDGTLRIGGKCMDVRGGNFNNGTQIQLWKCNGAGAQKFNVNQAHNLVNTSVGMCVGGKDSGVEPGTRLVLAKCNGTENQKWN